MADGEGQGGPTFLQMFFFYMWMPGIPNQKSQADADMQLIKHLIYSISFYMWLLIKSENAHCRLSWQVTLFCCVLCEWQTFWRDLHKGRQPACFTIINWHTLVLFVKHTYPPIHPYPQPPPPTSTFWTTPPPLNKSYVIACKDQQPLLFYWVPYKNFASCSR